MKKKKIIDQLISCIPCWIITFSGTVVLSLFDSSENYTFLHSLYFLFRAIGLSLCIVGTIESFMYAILKEKKPERRTAGIILITAGVVCMIIKTILGHFM